MTKPNKTGRKNKPGAGRPPFKPTQLMRQRVERYTMAKMTLKEISQAIGIEENTLKKHFPDELKYGLSRKRGEIMDMLFDSAEMGNVSAQRKLLAIATGDADIATGRFKKKEASDEDGEKKLGKKEQQALDAHDVGDKFKAPEPPKLVVNNK